MSDTQNTNILATRSASPGTYIDPNERPPESSLDGKQLQAALALAEGKTETQTAQLLEVNRTTIYRWQKQAAFLAEVNRLKQEYLTEYRGKVRELVAKATHT